MNDGFQTATELATGTESMAVLSGCESFDPDPIMTTFEELNAVTDDAAASMLAVAWSTSSVQRSADFLRHPEARAGCS